MEPRNSAVVVHGADVRDRGAAHFAGELRPGEWRSDLARIDQRIRCVELLESFEEERAFLREEERKALVDRHLPDVCFDL